MSMIIKQASVFKKLKKMVGKKPKKNLKLTGAMREKLKRSGMSVKGMKNTFKVSKNQGSNINSWANKITSR